MMVSSDGNPFIVFNYYLCFFYITINSGSLPNLKNTFCCLTILVYIWLYIYNSLLHLEMAAKQTALTTLLGLQ